MTLLSSSAASTSISAADLMKLKAFISDSLLREMENGNPEYAQRGNFGSQREQRDRSGIGPVGAFRHDAGQCRRHFVHRLFGWAECQIVRFDVGVLDRQVEQFGVDALKLCKSL